MGELEKSPFLTREGRAINPACGVMEYYRRSGYDAVDLTMNDNRIETIILNQVYLFSGAVLLREFSIEQASYRIKTSDKKAFYNLSSMDFISETSDNLNTVLIKKRLKDFMTGLKEVGPQTAQKFSCEWIPGPGLYDIFKMISQLEFFVPLLILPQSNITYQNTKYFVIDRERENFRLVWEKDMSLPTMTWADNRTPLRLVIDQEQRDRRKSVEEKIKESTEYVAMPSDNIIKVTPRKYDTSIHDRKIIEVLLQLQKEK